MKDFFKNIIHVSLIFWVSQIIPFASLVYNFRISEITKHPIFKNSNHKSHFISLLFEEYKKRKDNNAENYLGGLVSYIHNFDKENYFRIYGALSSIKEFSCDKTIYSGKEFDDILFNAGHNFKINHQSTVTLSILVGLPTHKVNRFDNPTFGFGQFSIGTQIDSLHEFNHHNSIYGGFRYIYFIPRNTNISNKTYSFSAGNLYDFLIGYRNHFNKKNVMETGYTIRFQNGSNTYPKIKNISKQIDFTRSNFYIVYKHNFKIKNIANRIILDFTYSFDHKPNSSQTKYIIGSWITWDINF